MLKRHKIELIEVNKACAVGGIKVGTVGTSISGLAEQPTLIVGGLASLMLLLLLMYAFRRRKTAVALPAGGSLPPGQSPKAGSGGGSIRRLANNVMGAGSSRSGLKLTGFDRDGHTLKINLRLGDLDSPYGAVIGRDGAIAEESIVDSEISRRHVRIFRAAGNLFVEDLASTNGTSIGGVRLTPFEAMRINFGDSIDLSGIVVKVGRG